MKHVLCLLALGLGAYSLNAQQAFTITGTAPNNEPIVISKITENGQLEDVANINPSNGKFTYKGSEKTPELYYITATLENGKGRVRNLMVAEKGSIAVALLPTEKVIKVSGTELNNRLQQYNTQLQPIQNEDMEARQALDKSRKDGTLTKEGESSAIEKMDKLNDQKNTVTVAFLKENINNILGQYFFSQNSSRISPQQLKEVVAAANSTTLQIPMLKKTTEYLAALERAAVGQPFIDIAMDSPDGQPIKLSDYVGKGKYVMIDFWASWCGPCKMEMPMLKEVYNKYKDKGFEIVAVSLDKDKDSWVKGIASLGITWPQMSDLKYWGCEAAKAYAVKGIPFTVLIAPDGKIIANGLRSEGLDELLNELLNK